MATSPQSAETSFSLDIATVSYKNKFEEESSSKSSKAMQKPNDLQFQKRDGTAGASGHLYETKLLSLFILRALNDKTIGEFYLGTNISGIGALDDICLRYKSKEDNKNTLLFIQAKHRNDAEKGKITIKDLHKNCGDFSLAKYFESYLQIRNKITPKSSDIVFMSDNNDLDSYFIIYTPAKHSLGNDSICVDQNNTKTNQQIKSLLSTDNHGEVFQLKYDDVDYLYLAQDLLENRVKLLGKIFLDFLFNKKINVMDNELIKSYHFALAQYVIDISNDITQGSRNGKFRPEFFNNHEKFIKKFRETLCSEVIRHRKQEKEDDISSLFFKIHESQTAENISKVIGSHIDFDEKSNRFILINKSKISSENFKYLLKDKQVNPSVVKNAIEIAGKECLLALEFKLPDWFGNIDITIRGNTLNFEKRVEFLATELLRLLESSTNQDGIRLLEINDTIVGPNKLLKQGFVKHNGGLGSAIGNLLIVDENTNLLKFNNIGVLQTNAKMLWEKLKNKMSENDLTYYRFKFCVHDFPKVSFADDFYEKSVVKDFINKLWYYAEQAKEETVENIAKKEIDKYLKYKMNSTCIFRVKTDAMFLKIHDEIQKWWIQPGKVSYITQNTDVVNRAMLDIVDNPLITTFNFIYQNKLKSVGTEFGPDAIKTLDLDTFTSGLLIIITDSNILTVAKLLQHFKDSRNCVFLDFNYIVSFTLKTLDSILSDLEKMQVETLIITLEVTNNHEDILKNDVLNRLNTQKIIIITNKQFQMEFNKDKIMCISVRSDKTSLDDLSSIAQDKILNESVVIFQGEEVILKTIIDDESKYLITPDVLRKLVNKEVLKLGKPLITSNYDKIKPFYVHRILSREEMPYIIQIDQDNDSSDNERYEQDLLWYSENNDMSDDLEKNKKSYEVNSLNDLKDDIVVVTATPGMGKSTLLTHLSLETKKICSNIWIARINLLDYSKQFSKWQHNRTVVDERETINFLCKAITNASENSEFEFGYSNNEIVLKSDKIDVESQLELDFFLYCYKNGKIIFLFDGFDEICPHYETEVIQLMKTTVNTFSVRQNIKQKVWITSRSYNNVKHIIEREFGKSYTLQPLCKIEQGIYLDKFWKKYINLEKLTYEQFANIDSFVTYMTTIDDRENNTIAYVKSISKPLHNVYNAALKYFQNEIKSIPLTEDIKIFKQAWDFDTTQPLVLGKLLRHTKNETEALTLSGSPLHMYIASEYFQNEIKNNISSDQTNKWDLDMNTFAFFKRFLEMKLTKIRFEEKNKIDVFKPDNKMLYDKERKDFVEEHKKLAFYAIFKDYDIFSKLITEDEIEEIKDMVDSIKFAKEKTGVIDCVVEDVPRFVHRTFAEYFATDYVCDLLKSAYSIKYINRQEIIWQFLFYAVMKDDAIGAFTIFDHKLANDEKLAKVLKNTDTERIVNDLLVKQTSVDTEEDHPSKLYWGDSYHPSYYRTALDVAVENGLRDTAVFLVSCVVKHLNKDNMKYFMRLLTENKLIHAAIVQGFDDIIDSVLDNLRRVNSSEIYQVLYDNDYCFGIFDDLIGMSNSEIIKRLHSTYNYRVDLKMDIFHARVMSSIFEDVYSGHYSDNK